MPNDFKTAFCERFRCPPEKYPRAVLARSLLFPGWICFFLARLIVADAFRGEHSLAKHVGRASTVREVKDEIDFYHHKYLSETKLRSALGVRVSGQKLIKLARDLNLP